MRARVQTRRRTDAGFTMTEVLVVILIVCILAAIAIPTLMSQRSRGADAVAKGNVATASQALVIYEQDHDTYACGSSAQCVARLRLEEPTIPAAGLDVSGSGGAGAATTHGYRVTGAGGERRTFWQDRDPGDDETERGCDLNGSRDAGGCRTSGGASSGQW